MNYKLLWSVWFTWATALLIYCLEWESRQELLILLLKIMLALITSFIILSLLRYIRSHKGMIMFKRKENASASNSVTEEQECYIPPQPIQDNSETVSAAMVVDKEATIIPSNCHINGEIKTSGDMKINGTIDGTITAERTVYVLSKGSVEGEIYAAKVVVDGKVTGVCASAVVEINACGLIDGTIESDDLSINKSGRFYGTSKPLAVKKAPPESKPAVDNKNSDEQFTIIQQVLDNVPDKLSLQMKPEIY